MTKRKNIFNGADALVDFLQRQGVQCVFGVPGSQNTELFESMRRNGVRTVLTSSELTAGFMANGWFRATGSPGVFVGIPGPGFAYAIPPLAEASLDTAAVLFITGTPQGPPQHGLQSIDQSAIAAPLVRASLSARDTNTLLDVAGEAWTQLRCNGPGPVVLQVAESVLEADWAAAKAATPTPSPSPAKICRIPDDLKETIASADRILIIAGAGALDASTELRELADKLNAVVSSTPSARGLFDELGDRCLGLDMMGINTRAFNQFAGQCDLTLVLGCRFSFNATAGFSIKLPADRLVHVDIDSSVLNARYDCRWPILSDVASFVSSLLVLEFVPRQGISNIELQSFRKCLSNWSSDPDLEPTWQDQPVSQLFDIIRGPLCDKAITVTDTGNHQILARKYLHAREPRSLIVPTDFQSMGFGLSAAIGAAIARPDRRIFAIIGDGSFLITGAELGTAVRQKTRIIILLFRDGYLGQIRDQQLKSYGSDFATE
jgi:acetolactate synthase-1/2/3 large subunit